MIIVRQQLKPNGGSHSRQKLAGDSPELHQHTLHKLFCEGAKKVVVEYPDGKKLFYTLDPEEKF